VTGAFEAEGLKVGFEVSQAAESLVQLRSPLVPPVGEARPDIEVIFDLATRLGLAAHFFDGSVDAGWAHHLGPSGITLQQLRADPAGVRSPLETRHRKYAAAGDDGLPAGFATQEGSSCTQNASSTVSHLLSVHGAGVEPDHADLAVVSRSCHMLKSLHL
jgi:anaerobic selenocysteine-containing dehydrogenase